MKKLSILGAKVAVKVKKIDDSLGMVAYYNPENNEIVIDPRYSKLEFSYFHEVFHSAWDRAGLNQTDVSKNIQEIVCEVFSTVMAENLTTMVQTVNKLKKLDPSK